jgi:hypothetical protein
MQYNIKITHLLLPKTCSILQEAKDNMGHKALGVYKIPCECCALSKLHSITTPYTLQIHNTVKFSIFGISSNPLPISVDPS